MKAISEITNRRLIALYKSGHNDTLIETELLIRSGLIEKHFMDKETVYNPHKYISNAITILES